MSRVVEQYNRACQSLAGGVSSSTRLNRAVGHAMYFDRAEGCRLWDLDGREYIDLCCSHGATLLGHGDPRVRQAVELVLNRGAPCSYENEQQAIENDIVPGPRLAASGREICGVAGLMDWNPDFRKIGMEGLVFLINGPDEARAAVRKLVKDGVEWVKTYPTGDAAAPDVNDHHTLCMTFEEMHAVVATAHNHHLKVTGHCRANAGIKNALRAGYDTIEHGTFMDGEALDLLMVRNTPVVPALRFELASIERGPDIGMPQRIIDGHVECLEGGAESARMILKAGGRIGMGGDFGFSWNPHGEYAKELSFFVNYVGFSPLETITCATKTGAEIIGRGDEFGTLEAGKLADVLVVDGDVLADITILEDRTRFLAVLQGGVLKAGRLLSHAQPSVN